MLVDAKRSEKVDKGKPAACKGLQCPGFSVSGGLKASQEHRPYLWHNDVIAKWLAGGRVHQAQQLPGNGVAH